MFKIFEKPYHILQAKNDEILYQKIEISKLEKQQHSKHFLSVDKEKKCLRGFSAMKNKINTIHDLFRLEKFD